VELDRPLDFVRLDIGDTKAPFMVQNETITALLGIGGITYQGVIVRLLTHLINVFATAADKSEQTGVSKTEWSQRLESWKTTLSQARSGSLPDPVGLGSDSGGRSVIVDVTPTF
jgi:hypothetical protein